MCASLSLSLADGSSMLSLNCRSFSGEAICGISFVGLLGDPRCPMAGLSVAGSVVGVGRWSPAVSSTTVLEVIHLAAEIVMDHEVHPDQDDAELAEVGRKNDNACGIVASK
eukprot:g10129.t1